MTGSEGKQLELEALAAVGEMLLFDKARGNPEEAAHVLRCARVFARSEAVKQRLSELCNKAGRDVNISPRIPPAKRTDAAHPQCVSTTPGGGQADGLA